MFIQSLQDTVAQFTTIYAVTKGLSGCEDGSHIFEVDLQTRSCSQDTCIRDFFDLLAYFLTHTHVML